MKVVFSKWASPDSSEQKGREEELHFSFLWPKVLVFFFIAVFQKTHVKTKAGEFKRK